MIAPAPVLPLAGVPLDRAGALRGDGARVAAMLADPAARVAPVWRGRSLVSEVDGGAPRAAWLAVGALPEPEAAVLLGLDGGAPVFAVDFSRMAVPPAPAGAGYEDLWRVGGLMPAGEAAILGQARALVHWQARHRFCGVCGAATSAEAAGHVRRCSGCGTSHFPRTDPAVIMLVHDGERALLARSQRFRNVRVFSTLAGFVEPGESLEEAVARETLEETGVVVAEARYFASQPWPFPGSVMLGFFARAVSTAIVLDETELVEAAWFSRAALVAAEGFMLPPRFSIARALIEGFLAGGGG